MVRVSIQTLLSALLASFFVIQVSSAATSSEDSNLGALLSRLRADSIPLEFDSLDISVPPELEEAYRQLIPMAYQKIMHEQGPAKLKFTRLSFEEGNIKVALGPGTDAIEVYMNADGHEIAVYYYYSDATLMIYCKDSETSAGNEDSNSTSKAISTIFVHPFISYALRSMRSQERYQGPQLADLLLAIHNKAPELVQDCELQNVTCAVARFKAVYECFLEFYDGILIQQIPGGVTLLFIGINPSNGDLIVKLQGCSCIFKRPKDS